MIDDDVPDPPADYDDSEPGTIPELFARPVVRDGGHADVLLPPPPPKGT